MKALQNLRRKVGAMIGGFEGGLSARRLKTVKQRAKLSRFLG